MQNEQRKKRNIKLLAFMVVVAIVSVVLQFVLTTVSSIIFDIAEHLITIAVLFAFLIYIGKNEEKEENEHKRTAALPQSAVEDVLTQTHPQFAKHFSGANADLTQVQNLLSDAIGKLLESFSGMQNLIQSQRDMALSIVKGDHGAGHEKTVSMEDFIQETSGTLQELVGSIVSNSKIAMELVEKMDEVSHQVTGILDVLGEIDGISKQTNLLALNAAIEAARAGGGG